MYVSVTTKLRPRPVDEIGGGGNGSPLKHPNELDRQQQFYHTLQRICTAKVLVMLYSFMFFDVDGRRKIPVVYLATSMATIFCVK
jgi:hypothetical protein